MLIRSNKFFWTALFSKTGYELSEIIKKIKIKPDRLVVNSSGDKSKMCHQMLELIKKENIEVVFTNKTPQLNEYREAFFNETGKLPVTTLHGWMRIIPPEISNELYNMYNGHPGLITRYPELKGKDPQAKAFKMKHEEIGTVIHRVTSEVDSGEIMAIASIDNTYDSEDAISDTLREMSILIWSEFLTNKFYD